MISMEAIHKLRALEHEGDPTLVQDLIRMFLESVPGELVRLEKAIQSGNRKELAWIAHPLKSSAATLGAVELSKIFAALEANGRADIPGTDNAGLLAAARTMFKDVSDELQNIAKG